MNPKSKPVLIVEDDESIRETLRLFLEFEGYRVLTASSGQEGLAALPGPDSPGLVLLDLMMPVMDGWQFVDKAKNLRPKWVIEKPVDLDRLLRIVHEVCGEPEECHS